MCLLQNFNHEQVYNEEFDKNLAMKFISRFTPEILADLLEPRNDLPRERLTTVYPLFYLMLKTDKEILRTYEHFMRKYNCSDRLQIVKIIEDAFTTQNRAFNENLSRR